MDKRKFTLWNRISAAFVLVVSAVTYLLTIEPTASFWDCGEFIASSYKLEVGHPPGNPVFQLIARFFPGSSGITGSSVEHAAVISIIAIAIRLQINLFVFILLVSLSVIALS